MIQLSRTQDEEVGDGTTSVIILAGELLQVCVCAYSQRLCWAYLCHDKQQVSPAKMMMVQLL
jgi:hypothetical protein